MPKQNKRGRKGEDQVFDALRANGIPVQAMYEGCAWDALVGADERKLEVKTRGSRDHSVLLEPIVHGKGMCDDRLTWLTGTLDDPTLYMNIWLEHEQVLVSTIGQMRRYYFRKLQRGGLVFELGPVTPHWSPELGHYGDTAPLWATVDGQEVVDMGYGTIMKLGDLHV